MIGDELTGCMICKDQMVVPVEFICMPCYQDNSLQCNSMVRICLWCAIHYLQLNLSISYRDYAKKCLYCPHQVRLNSLTLSNSFRIDFTLIRMVAQAHWQCPFCLVFEDSPLPLVKHILEYCPHYYYECPCGDTVSRQYFPLHQMECRLYEACSLCHEYFLTSKLTHHMKVVHNYIQCHLCHYYLHYFEMEKHSNDLCPHRYIYCTLCSDFIKFIQMESHLRSHCSEYEEQLLSLQQQQEQRLRQLQEAKKQLSIYSSPCLLITDS